MIQTENLKSQSKRAASKETGREGHPKIAEEAGGLTVLSKISPLWSKDHVDTS